MKTLLILSVVLCTALSVWAAAAILLITYSHDLFPSLSPARFSFCLDGWQSFSGKCYFLANHPDSWANAERFCASFDGSLASVRSIWEYNFLQRMVKTGGHRFAWIGGYYFEGEWRWEDGSRFDYSNWDTSSSTAYYQCLLLNSQVSKGWSNNGCNMRFPFVCQVRQLDC
uniref:Ladderlectin-like n=1 Tax=Seriola dumerili TaxID=41447 RepID=A0A3B4TM23_SERDU